MQWARLGATTHTHYALRKSAYRRDLAHEPRHLRTTWRASKIANAEPRAAVRLSGIDVQTFCAMCAECVPKCHVCVRLYGIADCPIDRDHQRVGRQRGK